MRIGERFYDGFELSVDHTEPTADVSFLTDLQNVRIGSMPVELTPMPVIVAPPVATPPPVVAPAVHVPALTPLELAVHELLAQVPVEPDAPIETSLDDIDEEPREPGDASAADLPAPHVASEPAKPSAHAATARPAATLAVREPAPLPENPNPSHVHVVLDDGADRIVATVAVRGTEVNVILRANDDEVAAALARNAATLDHAMRARGLDLAGFTTQRDPSRDHDHEHDHEPAQDEENA